MAIALPTTVSNGWEHTTLSFGTFFARKYGTFVALGNSVKYKDLRMGGIKLTSPRLVTSDCNLIHFTIIINMMTIPILANPPETIVNIFDSYLENMGV